MQLSNTTATVTEENIKSASRSAMASLLNLTFLPVIGFIWLIYLFNKTNKPTIDRYHAWLGIKLNLFAALALGVMTLLMIFIGGFDSVWTWIYVISYFAFVHALFIVIAVWAMVRAWSGQKLRN